MISTLSSRENEKTTPSASAPAASTIVFLGYSAGIRMSLRAVLAERGYQILEAVNEEHAEVLREQMSGKVDLIIAPEGLPLPGWLVRSKNAPMLHIGTELEIARTAGHHPGSANGAARILLVDENDVYRGVLGALLEHAGYTVSEAANGRDALHSVRRKAIDILITELVLPEIDGLQLLQEGRGFQPAMQVIAVSGSERADSYLGVARKLGAKAGFKKPLAFEELVECLRQLHQAKN